MDLEYAKKIKNLLHSFMDVCDSLHSQELADFCDSLEEYLIIFNEYKDNFSISQHWLRIANISFSEYSQIKKLTVISTLLTPSGEYHFKLKIAENNGNLEILDIIRVP